MKIFSWLELKFGLECQSLHKIFLVSRELAGYICLVVTNISFLHKAAEIY